MSFLLRLVLLVAGLIFAASLVVALAFLLVMWSLRAVWAKLTGRPVRPFVVRINPRSGFERMYRANQPGSRTPRADAVRPGQRPDDVTDVEPRAPGG